MGSLQFFKWLRTMENILSGSFFLTGTLVCLYGVFMRYIAGESQFWVGEVYTTLIVWAIFIGFGTALRDEVHVSIDLLYMHLNGKLKSIFTAIGLIIGFAFSIFFIVSGLNMTLVAFYQGILTLDLEIPIWISYMIMPLAGVLLLIHFIEKTLVFIKSLKKAR